MSEMDGQALAGLCVTEALFLRMTPGIDDMQLVQETTSVDGAGVEHVERKTDPGFKVVLELLKERRAQYAQFGMTPASRSKIVGTKQVEDDPIEAALH